MNASQTISDINYILNLNHFKHLLQQFTIVPIQFPTVPREMHSTYTVFAPITLVESLTQN